jgi:hypothetical protein
VLECAGGVARGESRRLRGARSIDAWIADVESAPDPEGQGSLDTIERLAFGARPGRVVAWISDFLFEPLPAAAFAALARAGGRRLAFIVCAHAAAFAAAGREQATLRDPEAGRTVNVQNDAAWEAAYHDVRSEHVAAVKALAVRHEFMTVAASADATFESCLMAALGA